MSYDEHVVLANHAEIFIFTWVVAEVAKATSHIKDSDSGSGTPHPALSPLHPSTYLPSRSHGPKPYLTLADHDKMVSLGQRYLNRWSGPLAHLFEESDDILADL